jgi:hypothetical protein
MASELLWKRWRNFSGGVNRELGGGLTLGLYADNEAADIINFNIIEGGGLAMRFGLQASAYTKPAGTAVPFELIEYLELQNGTVRGVVAHRTHLYVDDGAWTQVTQGATLQFPLPPDGAGVAGDPFVLGKRQMAKVYRNILYIVGDAPSVSSGATGGFNVKWNGVTIGGGTDSKMEIIGNPAGGVITNITTPVGGALSAGDYHVKYTVEYIDPESLVSLGEGVPSADSGAITCAANDQIQFDIPAINNYWNKAAVANYHIYRTLVGGSTYYWEKSVASNGNSALVAQTVSTADTTVVLNRTLNDQVILPPKASYNEIHQDRMWIGHLRGPHSAAYSEIHYNRIMFSNLGFPDQFETLNFIDVGESNDEITGLVSMDGILYIFKQKSIWGLYGDSPSNWTLRKVVPDKGSIAARSIVQYNGQIYFASYDGVYVFDGTPFPNLLSRKIGPYAFGFAGSFSNRAPTKAVGIVFNDRYYFCYDDSGADSANSAAIVLDLKTGGWTRHTGQAPGSPTQKAYDFETVKLGRKAGGTFAGLQDKTFYAASITINPGVLTAVESDPKCLDYNGAFEADVWLGPVDFDEPIHMKQIEKYLVVMEYAFAGGQTTPCSIHYQVDPGLETTFTDVNLSLKKWQLKRFPAGKVGPKFRFVVRLVSDSGLTQGLYLVDFAIGYRVLELPTDDKAI